MTQVSGIVALTLMTLVGFSACGGGQKESAMPDESTAQPSDDAEESSGDPAEPGDEGDEAAESSEPSEPVPCSATSFTFDEVRETCASEGAMGVKKLMKEYVKKGKEAGKSLKCSSCHDNTKTYTLSKNAVDDLRELMAL